MNETTTKINLDRRVNKINPEDVGWVWTGFAWRRSVCYIHIETSHKSAVCH